MSPEPEYTLLATRRLAIKFVAFRELALTKLAYVHERAKLQVR